jgi:phenylalanyl-tRNA synthetase beta chain
MKVPISWLKDYVDIDLSINDLAYALTMAGLEVEAIHIVGLAMPAVETLEYQLTGFEWAREHIVVAAIHEVKAHPNADRLVLCELDDGEQTHTVLTGAPNLFEYRGKGPLAEPIKVCYAREGATIINAYEPGNELTTLKRRKIRGVDSYSMACSERELGISEEHEGIIILDTGAPTGSPLQDYMGDAVLDIAITPNIARDANVLGVAREISAITGQTLRHPDYAVEMKGAPIQGRIGIDIPTPEINPRFVVGLIEDIEIQPSPYWVQRRLALAGQRPINNIVDVTNYVMLDIGQPLHAFDYDFLIERAAAVNSDMPVIHTRLANPGETLQTLDGETRKLDDFTVLVCDQKGSLALAGVMGGAESEVRENTSRVLLEGAAWNMINTRRTGISQRLSSEAAYRFSRGVHPEMAPRGVNRGLELMRQWSPTAAGGSAIVAAGLVDVYPEVHQPSVVAISSREVKRLLGLNLSLAAIQGILESLEFDCEVEADGETLSVTTPDHRMDIGEGVIGTADLMEEIARVYGYHNIPETRMADELPVQRGNLRLSAEERVRDLLVDAGLQEVITYRITSPDAETRRLPPEIEPADRPYLGLSNPFSAERSVMRQSLLASVLEIVERNARVRDRIAVFEIGPIFLASEMGDLPDELSRLVIALHGRRDIATWQSGQELPMDFFDLKGVLQHMFQGLHLPALTFEPGSHPSLHPGKSANIMLGDRRMGVFGELHPQVAERYDIPAGAVLTAMIYLDELIEVIPFGFESEAVPVFPPIIEDVAFILPEAVPAGRVEALIAQTGGEMLAQTVLFDVYRGEHIGPGKKSLAYRLTFQADRTLTDKEVAQVRNRIAQRLERELGALLRDQEA